MEQICAELVHEEDPLLVLLGRRGRSAVVRVLRSGVGEPWSARTLALAAGVPHVVAGRAVRELQALGAVSVERPGRDTQIRWVGDSVAGRFLEPLETPDLRGATVATFAAAYPWPRGVVALRLWVDQGDFLGDPETPTRIAVLWRRDEDAALDAVGPALDAVRAAGLPAPEVTTHDGAAINQEASDGDPTAVAIQHGRNFAPPG